MTTVTLHLPSQSVSVSALIDSGSDSEFIDESFAQALNVTLQPLPRPIQVKALDEHTIYPCSFQSVPIHVSIDNHHEDITFHVIKSPHVLLVLGVTWLCQHNPHIDWISGTVLDWGDRCSTVCLRTAAARWSHEEGGGTP